MSGRPEQLFVYGTLQDAARVDAIIGAVSSWRVVGAATARGTLYDLGRYPALVRGASRGRVPGVVLEIHDGAAALPVLDRYECVNEGLYERRRCRVRTSVGDVATAWVYLYKRPVVGKRRIAAWPPPP